MLFFKLYPLLTKLIPLEYEYVLIETTRILRFGSYPSLENNRTPSIRLLVYFTSSNPAIFSTIWLNVNTPGVPGVPGVKLYELRKQYGYCCKDTIS